MRKNKKRIMSLALALTVGVLAGCSSSGTQATTAGQGSEATTVAPAQGGSTETTAATTTGTAGKQDLTIVIAEDMVTFDPIGTSAMSNMAVLNNLYVKLYVEDENLQPVPLLVKGFTQVTDTELLFQIHQGAKFQDGTEITAEDVVYCLNRAYESPNFSTLMKAVDRFEKVDDYSFKIFTKTPAPSILSALSHTGTSILPKSYVEQALSSGDWSQPVASGPYQLKSRQLGDNVVLEKNENYFDPNTAAKNNSLTFKYVPEASSRTIMVETGEADVNFNFAAADYNRVSTNPKLKLHERSSSVTQYFGWDVTQAPFDNKLVRQAINYAIDREAVLQVVVEGLGTPAYSVLPPTCFGAVENPAGYTYDEAKAKELLAQAGYPNGFTTTICAFNDLGSRVAEVVQVYLAQVGITADIARYETSVRTDMIQAHQVPTFTGQWGAMSDPDLVLPRLFTKESIGGMNFTFYTNDDLAVILKEAASTYDMDKRIAYYEEAQKLLAEEAAWCPLYCATAFTLTNADLQGVRMNGESIVDLWNLHY